MAVTTLNATVNHGYIRSQASNYNNARAGSGTKTAFASANHLAGQQLISGTNYHFETFLEFDTSTITGTITSVVLKVYGVSIVADNPFTLQARLYDFSTSLTTADWVPGADTSGDTLLATLASGSFSTGAYNSFTNVAFPANINTSGKTRIYICTDNFSSGTPPGTNEEEFAWWQSATQANPPQLVITTSNNSGTLNESIGDFTLTADGDVITNASLNESFGDFTLTAAGNVVSGGSGVLAESIGDFTLTADGDVIINGYFEESIGEFTLAATSVVPLDGELLESIGEFTLVAAGGKPIEGTLTESIGDFELFATSLGGITASLTESIGEFELVAYQSDPPWPQFDNFPQSPFDGTWETSPGDDTLRSEQETGARQARDRNGGNYGEAQFQIMLKTYGQRLELDRFYEQVCAHGTRRFAWKCPETDEMRRWVWKAPPVARSIGLSRYIVECSLRKEAA